MRNHIVKMNLPEDLNAREGVALASADQCIKLHGVGFMAASRQHTVEDDDGSRHEHYWMNDQNVPGVGIVRFSKNASSGNIGLRVFPKGFGHRETYSYAIHEDGRVDVISSVGTTPFSELTAQAILDHMAPLIQRDYTRSVLSSGNTTALPVEHFRNSNPFVTNEVEEALRELGFFNKNPLTEATKANQRRIRTLLSPLLGEGDVEV